MRFMTILLLILLPSLCSCAWNNASSTIQERQASALSGREEAVDFFSRIHGSIRDTERAAYDFLYGVRDGVDSFIYDVEKDYYDDYQK